MEHVVKKGNHPYKDGQLITGKLFAEHIGVSGAAVSKAKSSGRISLFENSEGKALIYEPLAREEFFKNRNPAKVTTATTGQKAMGLTDFGARAVAQGIRGIATTEGPANDADEFDYALSRAKKENFAANVMEFKAAELEGRLVDKEIAGNKVKEIAASCKDRILAMHLKVAPAVVIAVEKALVDAGIDEEKVRAAISTAKIENVVGESVRKNVNECLRDIVQKEIDGFI